MHEDFTCVDGLILIELIKGVVFGEEVGCFLCKLLEDAAFVVLPNEVFILKIMELIIVLLGFLDVQFGDVLQRRREGFIGVDILIEVLLVFLFVVVDAENQDVVVDLALLQVELLIPLLKFLELFGVPSQLESIVVLSLSWPLGGEQPLGLARQFDENFALGFRLGVKKVAQEDSCAAQTAPRLFLLFLFDF
jgi:hypothetical protein